MSWLCADSPYRLDPVLHVIDALLANIATSNNAAGHWSKACVKLCMPTF